MYEFDAFKVLSGGEVLIEVGRYPTQTELLAFNSLVSFALQNRSKVTVVHGRSMDSIQAVRSAILSGDMVAYEVAYLEIMGEE